MTSAAGKLLIVDDDEDLLFAGRLLLRRHFAAVLTCSDPRDIESLMREHAFDVILLDMNFSPGESSGEQGFHWLRRILELDPDAVVVLITAHGGVDLAVEAMKQGATDFIAKPWQPARGCGAVFGKVGVCRAPTRRCRSSPGPAISPYSETRRPCRPLSPLSSGPRPPTPTC